MAAADLKAAQPEAEVATGELSLTYPWHRKLPLTHAVSSACSCKEPGKPKRNTGERRRAPEHRKESALRQEVERGQHQTELEETLPEIEAACAYLLVIAV